MINNISHIIFLTFLIFNVSQAQEVSNDLLNDKLFEIIEDIAKGEDQLNFYNLLENLIENPIDLNKATKNDLLRIPFISPAQASIIIKERKRMEGFTSIEDLYAVKNLHPEILKLLKLLVVFSSEDKTEAAINLRSRYLIDIQSRRGFVTNKFLGNKLKNFNRIKMLYGSVKLGFLSEKDAGENSYLDHYTGYLVYNSNNLIEQIILGDYNFEFGQGLVMWSPYSFSKSVDATNSPLKRERGFIPHSSSDENKSFRGIAARFRYGKLSLNTYYSQNLVDASFNNNDEITSFYDIGYHRTYSEMKKKENLEAKSFGASLIFENEESIKIGILHVNNGFDHNFDTQSKFSTERNKFNFSSLQLNFHINNLLLVGEASTNYKSEAYLTNFHFSITENISLLFSYRNYNYNFYSFYSNGFGEYGKTANERGFYFGSKLKTSIGTFNFYYDIFKSPNKSFKSDFPSVGNDFLISYNTKLLKNLYFSTKVKREQKELLNTNRIERTFDYENKTSYRIEFKFAGNEYFSGKTRFEYMKYELGSSLEEGKLFFQDIKYNSGKRLNISTRIIFFTTDSYISRIYEFENDLRGVLTNLPLYGEGIRWYFLFSYSPFKPVELSFKYSETYKPNERTLGSGNSLIGRSLENRMSFQLDYNL